MAAPHHPDRECVGGRLVDRHVGEYVHSRLQALLAAVLGSRERARRFRAFLAATVQTGAGDSYRIPDICVKALPGDSDSDTAGPGD
jgi:hypothetical protein